MKLTDKPSKHYPETSDLLFRPVPVAFWLDSGATEGADAIFSNQLCNQTPAQILTGKNMAFNVPLLHVNCISEQFGRVSCRETVSVTINTERQGFSRLCVKTCGGNTGRSDGCCVDLTCTRTKAICLGVGNLVLFKGYLLYFFAVQFGVVSYKDTLWNVLWYTVELS